MLFDLRHSFLRFFIFYFILNLLKINKKIFDHLFFSSRQNNNERKMFYLLFFLLVFLIIVLFIS